MLKAVCWIEIHKRNSDKNLVGIHAEMRELTN